MKEERLRQASPLETLSGCPYGLPVPRAFGATQKVGITRTWIAGGRVLGVGTRSQSRRTRRAEPMLSSAGIMVLRCVGVAAIWELSTA